MIFSVIYKILISGLFLLSPISSLCSGSTIINYVIKNFPVWEYKPSKFQWNFNDNEICLIIEGQAKVSTKNGGVYVIKAGNLV